MTKSGKFLRNLLLIICLFASSSETLRAQLSDIHYLPPLYSRGMLNNHMLFVATPSPTPVNVTVKDGMDNIIATAIVDNTGSVKIDLGSGYNANGVIEEGQLNTIIPDTEGLIVEADQPVAVQVRHIDTFHGLMLTSFGDIALGTHFRAGTAYSTGDYNERADFISIMASEDGTTVDFAYFTPGLELANIGTAAPFSVTLDQGDSYVVATHPTDLDNLFLNGALVTSDKDIAVHVGSWGNGNNGFIGRDISATQCIPLDKTGTEFILMGVNGDPDIERVIIVADNNNTEVFINDDTNPIANLLPGQYFILPSNFYTNDDNLYIQTSQPAFIYQTTGREDYNGGLNAIPPIDCWGAKQIIIPQSDNTFSASNSRINILAPVDATVLQNGTLLVDAMPVSGNTDWVTYQTNFQNNGDMLLSSSEYFQAGATLKSSFLGAATYFADYIQLDTLIDVVLCEGESIVVAGNTYDESGEYTEYLISERGCDSIINLNLQINQITNEFFPASICQGDVYDTGNNQYTEAGTYADTLLNNNGCDSIINFQLEVLPIFADTFSLSICEGELFNNTLYTSDTTVVQNLYTQDNCDSIVVTHLEVFESYSFYQFLFICEGESLEVGNSVYTESGIYSDLLTTVNGCDSGIVTQLTVTPSFDDIYDITLCQGDLYNGIPYFSDTTIFENLTTNLGCDSLVTTNLTVDSVKFSVLNTAICPGETVNGVPFFNDEIITDTLQSSNGCDSIVTNNISIQTFSSLDSVFINIGDPYNGEFFSMDTLLSNTLITAAGCDSIHQTQVIINNIITNILNIDLCGEETFEGNSYPNDTLFTEVFTAASGVDSIVNYFISVHPLYLDTFAVAICSGDYIFLEGALQNTPGFYTDNYSSIHGCDSTVVTQLFVSNIIVNNIDITVCDGEPYDGIVYPNDTSFVQVFAIDDICDSLVYTQITTGESNSSLDTVYLVDGEPFNGQTYSNDTLLAFNQTNYSGCDSLEQIQLIVLTSVSEIDSVYLCYGEIYNENIYYSNALLTDTVSLLGDSILYTFIFVEPLLFSNESFSICYGDSVFLENEWQFTSGLYQDAFPLPNGCDSIHYTNLVVADEIAVNIDTTVCTGMMVNDFFHMTDTLVADTLISFFGCDSILYFDLTVNPSYMLLDTITINEGDIYEGNVYTENTLLSENFLTSENCDSIVQTQLIVRPSITLNFDLTLCQGEELLGVILETDTILIDTLTALSGADSIHIYNIATTPYSFSEQEIGICLGDSILVSGVYQTTPGIYYDTLSVLNSCDSIVMLTLQVEDEFIAPQQAVICPGESFTFAGTDYSQSGTYRDTLLAAGGCDSIVVLSLTVLQENLTVNDEEICEGQIFILPFSDDVVTTTSTVFDTLTAFNGCDSIVQTNVLVTPEYFADIQSDGTYCENETTVLEAGSFTAFKWSTGAITPQIEVGQPGTYHVTVTNEDGCISRDSIVIGEPTQLDISYEIGSPVCYGEAEGFIHIDTVIGGQQPHLYSLNGSDFVPYLDWDFLESGAYDLIVKDADGCLYEEQLYINDPAEVQVDLGQDIYLSLGDSVRLSAAVSGDNLVINWSPADFLSCDSCFSTIARPLDNRRYFATVTDTLIGCSSTDDIRIFVNKNPDIYVPNSFSPNNDGENDFLTVYAKDGTAEVQSFQIFNRWGGIVFQRQNFNPNNEVLGWDGKLNGRVVNPGVFIYLVKIRLASGEIKVLRGDLTVLY